MKTVGTLVLIPWMRNHLTSDLSSFAQVKKHERLTLGFISFRTCELMVRFRNQNAIKRAGEEYMIARLHSIMQLCCHKAMAPRMAGCTWNLNSIIHRHHRLLYHVSKR